MGLLRLRIDMIISLSASGQCYATSARRAQCFACGDPGSQITDDVPCRATARPAGRHVLVPVLVTGLYSWDAQRSSQSNGCETVPLGNGDGNCGRIPRFHPGHDPLLVVVAIPLLSWEELNRRPPDPRIATHSLGPPFSPDFSFSTPEFGPLSLPLWGSPCHSGLVPGAGVGKKHGA